VTICINPYGRHVLGTSASFLSFFVPLSLSVAKLSAMVQKLFPGTSKIAFFSLFGAFQSDFGPTVKKFSLISEVKDLPPTLHLQAENPFELAKSNPPSFASAFLHLKYFNSSLMFSPKYNVEIFGHFIRAQKKSQTDVEYVVEITEEAKTYTQKVGDRVFCVIEQHSAKWTLYSKTTSKIKELLNAIESAPRHKPRLIEIAPKKQPRKTSFSNAILEESVSSASINRLCSLFPSDIPNLESLTDSTDPHALFKKVEMHLQRSIWDSVTTELLLCLLHEQKGVPVKHLSKDVKEFSAHLKRVLEKLKDTLDV